MDEKRRIEALLSQLEEAFERVRKPVVALYPYDKEARTISLPKEIEAELRQSVRQGQKPKAVKRVTELSGAGLRLAKIMWMAWWIGMAVGGFEPGSV